MTIILPTQLPWVLPRTSWWGTTIHLKRKYIYMYTWIFLLCVKCLPFHPKKTTKRQEILVYLEGPGTYNICTIIITHRNIGRSFITFHLFSSFRSFLSATLPLWPRRSDFVRAISHQSTHHGLAEIPWIGSELFKHVNCLILVVNTSTLVSSSKMVDFPLLC